MKKILKKRRRGDITVVLVFSVVMAILMLGMLKVTATLYATNRMQERQYADIQTMRAINETACYTYVADLQACRMTRDTTADMPGTSDSVIIHESLEELQKAMADFANTNQTTVWKVQDASTAIGAAGFTGPDIQASLLSLVAGRAHAFTLELEEDYTLDAEDMGLSYVGATDLRVKLLPVKLKATLQVKSETVVNHFSVEGLYVYLQKSNRVVADGSTHAFMDMVITDDGLGSGVQIYRAD